jgi:hypothetical protein
MADETKFSAEHVSRLRLALRQFLQVCEEALHINRSLVESEQQRSFHDELVQVLFYADLFFFFFFFFFLFFLILKKMRTCDYLTCLRAY